MQILQKRRIPPLLVLLLMLTGSSPLLGPGPAANPHVPSDASRAVGDPSALRLVLRRSFHFDGSELVASGDVAPLPFREPCGGASGTRPSCAAHRFRSSLRIGIEGVLPPPPRSPEWRLAYHRIAAGRPDFELVELRCDLNADGEITPDDLRLAGDILAELVAPSMGEARQLDVAPVGAPDGWLDSEDLAVLDRALAGERAACEVSVTKLRRLRDADGDGVLRIACLGDSNSCFGHPFRCGPIRGLCDLLQELSPEIASADGKVLPSEFVSYAWAGTTICDVPNKTTQFGARAQYQQARNRADPGATDAVLLAFGTNDYGVLSKRPDEIAACYEDIVTETRADGIASWVALTPPVAAWPSFKPEFLEELALRNEHARETNRVLRQAFPVYSLVDFFSGFESLSLFVPDDPLHLDDEGQRLRARRVLDALH